MTQSENILEVEKSAYDVSKLTSSAKKPKYWYSAEKLLSLRHSLPLVKCPIKNINKKADIGNSKLASLNSQKLIWNVTASIFRLPEQAFNASDQFICRSKVLAEFASRYKVNQIDEIKNSESSTESEKPLSNKINTINAFHQPLSHWNFRRRESTEKSPEPYSAPSGTTAQKAENFQKFYRAVISPTHVRVTAGGRIVPNSKPTGNPGQECFNDRARLDHVSFRTPPLNLQATPWPHLQPIHPVYPIMMPNNVSPLQNHLRTDNSIVLPPQINQTDSYYPVFPNPNANPQTSNSSVNTGLRNQEPLLPHVIKISHPSQFDQTKPFAINGQIVYPLHSDAQVSANPYPLPIEMMDGSTPIPQIQPSFFHQALNVPPFRNITNSVALPHNSQATPNNQQPGTGMNPKLTPNSAPALPIPTMDFLDHQLRALYNSRSEIDKQIANNNSQIDGSFLESQRNWIECQINTVKNALAIHHSQETSAEGFSFLDRSTSIPPTHLSDTEAVIPPQGQKNHSTALPNNLEKCPESIHDTDIPKKAQIQSHIKSRLTISSAKAPPFKPRSHTINDLGANNSRESEKSKNKYLESISQENKNRGQHFSKTLQPSTGAQSCLEWSSLASVTQSDSGNLESTLREDFNDHAQSQNSLFPSPISKCMGAPYLVGTFPRGSQPNTISYDEILYSRPLTWEEQRARYLYFGKISRPAHSDLPKFDGKDFYPPSPTKNSHNSGPQFNHNKLLKKGPNTSSSKKFFEEVDTSKFGAQPLVRYRNSMQNLSKKFSDQLYDGPGDNISQRNGSPEVEIASRPQIPQEEKYLNGLEVDYFNNFPTGSNESRHATTPSNQNHDKLASKESQYNVRTTSSMPQTMDENMKDNQKTSGLYEKTTRRSCASSTDSRKPDSMIGESKARINLSPKFKETIQNLPDQTFVECAERFRRYVIF